MCDARRFRILLPVSLGVLGGVALYVGVGVYLDGMRWLGETTRVDEAVARTWRDVSRGSVELLRSLWPDRALIEMAVRFELTLGAAFGLVVYSTLCRARQWNTRIPWDWSWLTCFWGIEGIVRLHVFLQDFDRAERLHELALAQWFSLLVLLLLRAVSGAAAVHEGSAILCGCVVFVVACDWLYVLAAFSSY